MIQSVAITPAGGNLTPGQNITVVATSSDSKTYAITTGSTITVKAKYGIITVFSKTLDLCQELEHTQYPCPIQPYTPRQISASVPLPASSPKGTYSGSATATDQEGNLIICINFQMIVQ